MMNRGNLRLVQADREELAQAAPLTDDAERTVPGGDQFYRRLDDLPEHHLELQVAADGDDGFEQSVRPVPGVKYRLQPQLQFHKEVIEPQMWQQRAGILALHRYTCTSPRVTP